MDQAKAAEYAIIRTLMRRRAGDSRAGRRRRVEVLIHSVAGAAAVALLGSYAPELLWAGLAASTVFVLGTH